MRIQNLKLPSPGTAMSPVPAAARTAAAPDDAASEPRRDDEAARLNGAAEADRQSPDRQSPDRQSLEIALLKARIQHLELVVETARGLMGSNQERLLRRLHEVPGEMLELSTRLRRLEPRETG